MKTLTALDEQVKKVVTEFRRLKDMTQPHTMQTVLSGEFKTSIECQKFILAHMLFELQELYCAEHGSTSTNPMVNPPVDKHDPDFGDPNPNEGFC